MGSFYPFVFSEIPYASSISESITFLITVADKGKPVPKE
jgi:hypothetical protein